MNITVFKEALTCIQHLQICEYPSKVYMDPSGNFRKSYNRMQVTMQESQIKAYTFRPPVYR